MNGDVIEKGRKVYLKFEDLCDVTLEIGRKSIEDLAEKLRIITSIDASSEPEFLSEILKAVAVITSHAAPKVNGRPEDSGQLEAISLKIGTDFAIACAACLARERGHILQSNKLPRHEICMALQNQDSSALSEIFQRALKVSVSVGVQGQRSSAAAIDENLDALFAELEDEFAASRPIPNFSNSGSFSELSARGYSNLRTIADRETWDNTRILRIIEYYLNPNRLERFSISNGVESSAEWAQINISLNLADQQDDPEDTPLRLAKPFNSHHELNDPSDIPCDRTLTALSYWNLRSIADMERWTNAQILLLIEEHLNPILHFHLVHHSSVVSGDDWLRLHAWINRSDGLALWASLVGSSRQL
jgi:hypothetical protein